VEQKGLTLIPLAFYFNSKGRVKVNLGVCRGKNAGDKREALKEREDKRDMERMRRSASGRRG
ncbi:MAG: SsrA-binding protein, partial [Victivallales bacterium]|nr:SsrA-binding protein [Victivallales bacterium]